MGDGRHWTIQAPLWLLGFAVAGAAAVAIFSPVAPTGPDLRAPRPTSYTVLAAGATLTGSNALSRLTDTPAAAISGAALPGLGVLRYGVTGSLALAFVGVLVVGSRRTPARFAPPVPSTAPGTGNGTGQQEFAPTDAEGLDLADPRRVGPAPVTPSWVGTGKTQRAPRTEHVASKGGTDLYATGGDALGACARAVEAAHRYDRESTRRNFQLALRLDRAINPGGVAGFWDMPSGGHADLARAYLDLGERLDARTVLTLALITFRHNRELEALLREANSSVDAQG